MIEVKAYSRRRDVDAVVWTLRAALRNGYDVRIELVPVTERRVEDSDG